MFQSFIISSLAFFESIVAPAFADIVPGSPQQYNGTLGEFTVMDNVTSKRPIVDIRRVQNILQRRDASCDINYKKVVGATTRQIAVDEIYGATQFCRNEFYQGCLKDWRNNDPVFGNKILPYFIDIINVDLASNSYFGDIERVTPVNAQWSTSVFDGVFKWIKKYITAAVIPAAQTIAIADATDYSTSAGNLAAYNLLKAMYDKQPPLMYSFADSQKAFYVSKEIATGYSDYLASIGITAAGYTLISAGMPPQLSYKGIPILVEPIWTPIITEIKGAAGYAAILTLRGNFVFATDKQYGEGEDGKTALEVWYEKKDMRWYYRMFLKAGTQVALPEHLVIALSSWT
jgi:hypothetical protein